MVIKQTTKVGTLNDGDILDLCMNNHLIIGEFSREFIKQACYELRASKIYYDLADANKKYEIDEHQYILIKPKQLVVIITKETIELPADILGRILTKGKLFSIGLLPVNTYADPGFYGNLGIVFYNLSNNYIKIIPGEPIAKIEFTRLEIPVNSPYHGQHGYQTRMWPIPTEMILSSSEIRKDKRIKQPEEEISLSYGKDLGKVLKRVFSYERKLILASILYFIFSTLLIVFLKGTEYLSTLVSVILGVVSNLVFGLLIYFATNLRKSKDES